MSDFHIEIEPDEDHAWLWERLVAMRDLLDEMAYDDDVPVFRRNQARQAVIDTGPIIADGSVDLIATSPPFLALRSYVPADHVSKGDEIGSERNPAEFI